MPRPIEQLRAIARSPRPTSNFNLRTSLILRTDNLLAGKLILPFEGRLPAIVLSSGLCCKNNSVGETEPTANLVGRLFSFQSEDFPDELNLPKDIPFRQPPHLAFPDHVQNLVALNRPPGSIERSKTLAGIHPPLDRSMVLFHNIV